MLVGGGESRTICTFTYSIWQLIDTGIGGKTNVLQSLMMITHSCKDPNQSVSTLKVSLLSLAWRQRQSSNHGSAPKTRCAILFFLTFCIPHCLIFVFSDYELISGRQLMKSSGRFLWACHLSSLVPQMTHGTTSVWTHLSLLAFPPATCLLWNWGAVDLCIIRVGRDKLRRVTRQ